MLTDFKSRFIEMFGTIDNSHFKYTALEQLCYILDSQRIPITAKDRVPGPYPYYGANGVQDYVADYIFDDELILLAEDGGHFDEIGRIAYMISGKCWVNNHAHILKPKSGLNIYYLLHSLNMIDLSMEVNGTTRQKLTQTAMRRIKLPLPPVELQNQFADFVQQVDKSKVIKESVKSRFIEMFGNLDINDKQWKMSTIGESAKVPLHYGSTASAVDYDSETRYVRITDIGSDGKLNDDFKSPSTYDSSYLLNKGDILFARSGSVGVTYLFDEDYKSIFAGYLIRFIPDDEKLDPEFTYQFTRSSYCQGILVGSKRGGVQKNVNAKQLSAIPIPLPPMDLQKEFVDFVHQVDKSKVGVLSTILLINIYINTEA